MMQQLGGVRSADMAPSASVGEAQRRPVLPKDGARNILITSALPYVNNVPHLGNIIGCVLSADVYARFCRLRGHNAIYVCGTDEYGTATEQKAIQEGLTPREICDKFHAIHAQVYEWFGISFDIFGRTSTPLQTEIVQRIFKECETNGIVHEDTVEQLFCTKCDMFLADRYVRGTCPDCGHVGAHGDQCDKCGHLMTATLLKDPYCASDKSTPVIRKTEHLFLDLPLMSERLEKWIDQRSEKGFWSQNSIQVTKAWIATGLKSRSITRDLKWGVPVPKDGFRDKVFYVWFDAPIGYMSITAAYTPEWERWWRNPEQVELVQFMGKDNIPFHTVIWPSVLLGADQGYTMLHHINTTEYLQYESGKFSKSMGVGVFGDSVQLTGVSPSVWRYYLLVNRPETNDTVFTWDDFMQKNNGELLKNVGNFVNRALVFIKNNFSSVVPECTLTPDDESFIKDMNEHAKTYVALLEKVEIKDGLKQAMQASHRCNLYLQDNAPWHLIKDDKARAGSVINVSVNAVVLLATMLEPYMPELVDRIFKQLNTDRSVLSLKGDGPYFRHSIRSGHVIGEPQVLFTKISEEQITTWRRLYAGQQPVVEDFPLNLVTGVIRSVSEHETAEHLFVLQVDIGSETRQIVSGLRAHYSSNELLNKKVVVLTNLKASNFRGVRSAGMLLCGVKPDGSLGLLLSPGNAGDRVGPKGYNSLTSSIEKKHFSKVSPHLRVGDDSLAYFHETPIVVADTGNQVVIDRIQGPAQIS
ncbi:methionine--tRNA ligase [Plasmodiophora brassicae]|uniref:methionine--tRNA ligase n=1 Tax=Plasmodiophora brassicae TaxID=37360 RepID=A0A3P3XZ46_PLABS|nr:unnamed protein product [Plasmodiophora brassicae]